MVKPFDLLGPEEDGYLAEGMAEEVRDQLTRLAALQVFGRQTAVYAKDANWTDRQIGERALIQCGSGSGKIRGFRRCWRSTIQVRSEK